MRNDKGYRKLIAWQKSNLLASLTELEFFIDFSYERKFINLQDYENIISVHTEAARVLSGLLKST